MTVYKLEAGIRFLTEKYGKCLSPLEHRERGQKEKVTQFTLILRSVVLVFRGRDMCWVCQNKEINRMNKAAWKKYEGIKKSVNKGRKMKRTRYRK
jgi:hypothetical protein